MSDDPQLEAAEDDPTAPAVEATRQVVGSSSLALDAAKAAAPYMHPRIVDSAPADGSIDDFVPLAERIREWERRAKLRAAGGDVVDLNSEKRGPST